MNTSLIRKAKFAREPPFSLFPLTFYWSGVCDSVTSKYIFYWVFYDHSWGCVFLRDRTKVKFDSVYVLKQFESILTLKFPQCIDSVTAFCYLLFLFWNHCSWNHLVTDRIFSTFRSEFKCFFRIVYSTCLTTLTTVASFPFIILLSLF